MGLTTLETGTSARESLLSAYSDLLRANPDLDRSLVSFQANKHEPFYRWFKYKEGFSSRLVAYFLNKFDRKPGVLLDPFAGAGAALFASRDLGWDAIGIEILPVGFFGITARLSAEKVDPEHFANHVRTLKETPLLDHFNAAYAFPHISITEGAFSPQTEKEMAGFLAYCEKEIDDPHVRNLFKFACFCILEEISYTRKDGQYLRWDYRSRRNRVKGKFSKGKIPPFHEAIRQKLERMAEDLLAKGLFLGKSRAPGSLDIREGSCLEILPEMRARSIDFVITSPPYCNRYDYTRTYALELAFLGFTNSDVKRLRQEMLSCTVENREKKEQLRQAYSAKRQPERFRAVEKVFEGQEALQETLAALDLHKQNGGLNNANIARMVKNYFYEMCFVVCELARVLHSGGKVVMVNDNVRYAGEEIPVDLILSDFATAFGLKVRHIWTLPRGKGNSSQQMGTHGRRELRKCVYVWEK